jgi:membrane peptidoglycan carboxypeptidase
MTVEATYDSPSTKEFKVVSQSGSKLILDRVLKKLLESEKEAAQPAISARTQLNRDNYDFEMVGYEASETGGQYVLRVSPKSRSKYVYRGKVWVDGTDFAVTRIEGEPAQNPSFWTKKSEIHHEYKKVQAFWLPARNESVSYIRLGGRATLTIEYKDYRVTDARQAKR